MFDHDGNLSPSHLATSRLGIKLLVRRGASFPVVLKPTVADETFDSVRSASIKTFYRFVGGAYVDGIMDGEVMDMIDDGVCVEECLDLNVKHHHHEFFSIRCKGEENIIGRCST